MVPYQQLLDEAMLGIVKNVLEDVSKNGLQKDQFFYISFITSDPGVKLSKRVKEQYPHEITIILQYQFSNLKITRNKFEVRIAFGGVPETIIIPFGALTSFVDPNENFSLKLNRSSILHKVDDISNSENTIEREFIIKKLDIDKSSLNNSDIKRVNIKHPQNRDKSPGKVISLDKFKKERDYK